MLTAKDVAPGTDVARRSAITWLERDSMDHGNLWLEPQRDCFFFFFPSVVRNKERLRTKEFCCLTDVVEVFLFGPAGQWFCSTRRAEEDNHSKKVTCDVFAQTCQEDANRRMREGEEKIKNLSSLLPPGL